MTIALLILGLVLFVTLVVVHEWGHFIAARRNNVEVEEFGIGFPPRAYRKRMKSSFDLTINWLPLGGFVKLKGEHDSDTAKGSYGAAPLGAKVKIMIAGVVMNLLVAYLLFTVVALMGMPKLIDGQFTVARDAKVSQQKVFVGYVEPGSPAEAAGIKAKDLLVSVAPTEQVTCQATDCPQAGQASPVTSEQEFPNITKRYAGQPVIVTVERGGQQQQLQTTLRDTATVEASKSTDEPKGYLGIIPLEYVMERSTWSAPIVAAGIMKQFTVATYQGIASALKGLFTGNTAQATEQVAGPIGIFVVLRDGSLFGLQFILMVVAVISLTLAIINILPIPALDGGRLFVTLLFRAMKKPLGKRQEELIHGTGFAALMVLFVLVTVVDVRRFF